MQDTTSFPLKGITILDLSRVLAGPYCTMILAQLGARVIKVEIPGTGDDSRAFGPFANGKSLYFASINYDKQSIALNLKEPADRETFEGLVGIGEGTLVLSTVKEQLRLLGQAAPLTPETFERVQELRRRVYQSNDYLEGIRAFHEKRKPVFNAT